MDKLLDKTITWIISLIMAFTAVFTNNADAIGFSMLLSLGLVILDFFTGLGASFCEGKSIQSKRLRWSFAKTLVYGGVLIFTLAIGVILHLIAELANTEKTSMTTLVTTLTIVKLETYVISYIEVLSNVENLRRIFPNNVFLKYLHWILSVEIIKKIPKYSEFLKERENNKKFK